LVYIARGSARDTAVTSANFCHFAALEKPTSSLHAPAGHSDNARRSRAQGAQARVTSTAEFRGPAFTGVLKKPAATPGEPRLPGDSPPRPPLSLDH
jgi:hypothetical protein